MAPILVRLAAAVAALVAPAAAQAMAPRCDLVPGAERVGVAGGAPVRLHVPAGYDGRRPLPLVFTLHGSGSNGGEQLQRSGLSATADRHGFLLAAPDGGIAVEQGFVWNIPGVPIVGGAMPPAGARDETAYLGRIIDALVQRGCADRTRVYATGLSGGGRMTSWLGCHLSARVAAIAPVVGLRAGNPDPEDDRRPDPATCAPKRPMPVLAFAGGKDTTNPNAGGGAGYWRYSVDAALARWARLNRCRRGPATAPVAGDVTIARYTRCRDGVEVALRIDADGGHSWDVADNEAMWRFFARYRRR